MIIDKHRILYRKEVYSDLFIHTDEFGSITQNDKHKFSYKITISKCWTLSGVVWGIDMPNRVDYDKNLYRLIVRSIEYAATEFPSYFRLKEELYRKGFWKQLG